MLMLMLDLESHGGANSLFQISWRFVGRQPRPAGEDEEVAAEVIGGERRVVAFMPASARLSALGLARG